MAPVKIERVISASSEDEAHPASNLLKTDYTNKKWKCKTPGEKQISVVFQLAEFCRIFSIDVGNEHSAFIEVLVGKSSSPNDDYKVLLVTSSLMTLQESKYSTNVNGVSFFKEESLCKPVCEEKWDRVKVVCSQPFNNHVQFGLSFIIFHSDISSTIPTSCNNIKLKATSSVDSLLKTGGLFANRNKLTVEPTAAGAAAIRAVAADVKINFPVSDANRNGIDLKAKSPSDSPRDEADSDDGILKCLEDSGSEFEPSSDGSDESFNLTDEDAPNYRGIPRKKTKKTARNENAKTPKNDSSKKKKNIHTDAARTGDSSNNSPPKKKIVLASVQAFKKREERPFNQLFSGVVFAMSGYENPLRSELRNKALAMGARYEFNWNCNCTHLICAFRNTPKYNQVRGRGKIVKSQWIEECYSRRKRLPWRRFALDRNDASQAESEEEICEKIETPIATTCKDEPESEDDTDDEIEKVRQNQQKINNSNSIDTPSTSGLNVQSTNDSTSEIISNDNDVTADDAMDVEPIPDTVDNVSPPKVKRESNPKEETDIYDMDTESEDDNYWVKTKPEENSLPPLPAFLEGATIALLDDLSDSDKNLLRRYIKAHKGSIADSKADLNMILYAITEDLSAIERVKEDFPQVMGATPEWIWRSHDEAKLLPASLFQIK